MPHELSQLALHEVDHMLQLGNNYYQNIVWDGADDLQDLAQRITPLQRQDSSLGMRRGIQVFDTIRELIIIDDILVRLFTFLYDCTSYDLGPPIYERYRNFWTYNDFNLLSHAILALDDAGIPTEDFDDNLPSDTRPELTRGEHRNRLRQNINRHKGNIIRMLDVEFRQMYNLPVIVDIDDTGNPVGNPVAPMQGIFPMDHYTLSQKLYL